MKQNGEASVAGAVDDGFDEATIQAVWLKARPAPGWASFREDQNGALMHRRLYGVPDKWGWRISYKRPLEEGGTADLDNLVAVNWNYLEARPIVRQAISRPAPQTAQSVSQPT
jgi:hypothetical protein